MPWQPGQSGNPKGRTPRERTLTAQLVLALEHQTLHAGHILHRKDILAALVAEGLTTLCLTLPGEPAGVMRKIPLSVDQWLALVRFVYTQVDGPPVVQPGGDDDLDFVLDSLHDLPALPAPTGDLSPAE